MDPRMVRTQPTTPTGVMDEWKTKTEKRTNRTYTLEWRENAVPVEY